MRVGLRRWFDCMGSIFWANSALAQAPAAQFPPEPSASVGAPASQAPTSEPEKVASSTAIGAPAPLPAAATPAPIAVVTPKPLRNWNLGAGVSLGEGSALSASALSYRAALERRLGERSWLALNARVSYDTIEAPSLVATGGATPAGTVRLKTTNAAALLGVRHVFARGAVDVSGYAAVSAGYRDVNQQELANFGAFALLGNGDGYDLGLLLGAAVERELIDALTLRLTLDLASASISSNEASRIDDAGATRNTRLGSGHLGLNVRPALQLHFYF